MTLPELPFDFYGAIIQHAALGLRREITFTFELWPIYKGHRVPVWEPGEGRFIQVRLGGITNFPAVHQFFSAWDDHPSRHCGLHYFRYDPETPSKPGKLRLNMQFDSTEDEISISCSNVTFEDAQ